jgi:hypothetical protein
VTAVRFVNFEHDALNGWEADGDYCPTLADDFLVATAADWDAYKAARDAYRHAMRTLRLALRQPTADEVKEYKARIAAAMSAEAAGKSDDDLDDYLEALDDDHLRNLERDLAALERTDPTVATAAAKYDAAVASIIDKEPT